MFPPMLVNFKDTYKITGIASLERFSVLIWPTNLLIQFWIHQKIVTDLEVLGHFNFLSLLLILSLCTYVETYWQFRVLMYALYYLHCWTCVYIADDLDQIHYQNRINIKCGKICCSKMNGIAPVLYIRQDFVDICRAVCQMILV